MKFTRTLGPAISSQVYQGDDGHQYLVVMARPEDDLYDLWFDVDGSWELIDQEPDPRQQVPAWPVTCMLWRRLK